MAPRAVRNTDGEFERAFAEHYARVYGVLVRLIGDRAEAEDLAV
jgi:DNA-directed RNA polymerase specialized sigma24 family protein